MFRKAYSTVKHGTSEFSWFAGARKTVLRDQREGGRATGRPILIALNLKMEGEYFFGECK